MSSVSIRPPLARPRRAVLGGVCAGVADHLGWPIATTRLVAIALTAFGGGGALLYAWLWALVPLRSEAPDDAGVRRSVPVAAVLVAVAAVAAVSALAAAAALTPGPPTLPLLAVMFAAGGAVLWSLGFDRADPGRSRSYGLWVRSLSSGLLLVTGTGALLARPTAIDAVLAVGLLVLGIVVLIVPRIVALWSDLLSERATRVREEQRAEIAAHLHDSVLQTLALIQNRAGPSSEVARIARAQERELRDWLFAGDAPEAADLATELREIAAGIELDWPARIDIVTAGEPVGQAGGSLVAAAREAMLNAARHAGGDVSVYLESSNGVIDVFVRDRGPGVDLHALPDDRLGIRESIIGRMTRAGGSATVRPGAGGTGTEVHLHLEAAP